MEIDFLINSFYGINIIRGLIFEQQYAFIFYIQIINIFYDYYLQEMCTVTGRPIEAI